MLLGRDQVPEAHFAIGVPAEAAFAKASQALMANLVGLGIGGSIAIIAALSYSEAFILRKVMPGLLLNTWLCLALV